MDHCNGDKELACENSKEDAKSALSQEVFGEPMGQSKLGQINKDESFGLLRRIPDEVRLGGTKIYYGEKEPGKKELPGEEASSVANGFKRILEDLDKDTVPQWLVKGSGILEDLDKDTVPQWLMKGSKILEDLDKDVVPQLLMKGSGILEDLDKDTVPQFMIGKRPPKPDPCILLPGQKGKL